MVLYGFIWLWFYMVLYGYNIWFYTVLFLSSGGSTCQLNILAICGWSVRSCVPIFCLFLVPIWFFHILSGCVSSDELLEDYLFYPPESVGRWLSLSSMVNQALKYRESPTDEPLTAPKHHGYGSYSLVEPHLWPSVLTIASSRWPTATIHGVPQVTPGTQVWLTTIPSHQGHY